MKVRLYIFITLSLSILLFVGCGSEYEEPTDTASNGSNIANGTEACVQEHYRVSVIPEIRACGACHHSLGAASNTALLFPNTSSYTDLANYTSLKSYISAHPQSLINKIDGTDTHDGGSFASTTITTLQDFSDFTRNVNSCVLTELAPLVSPIPLSAVKTANSNKIVDLASQALLSRSASTTEIADATNEAGLDNVLDDYMNDPAFYEWIKFSFNEFLFTDKYIDDYHAYNLPDINSFPDKLWFQAEMNTTIQDELRRRINYGIVKGPLELIANVIKKDQPFSEILTADYIMVNPYSAKSYNATVADVNFTVYNLGNDYTQLGLERENFTEATVSLPSAGILTDTVFLWRYPTTNTNVNRQRASRVMLWFLNTDILALASRAISSNDQAETFANPTLENPNCAVCHKVMDPVTGAFKNWGTSGGTSRFIVNNNWPVTSGPIGLSLDNLMDNNNSANALQWLANEIVNDERFSRSVVQIFYKALTSRDALQKPSTADPDYVHKMQAFMFQDVIFRNLSESFSRTGMNAKSLIKEIIKSPLFSALYTTQGTTNSFFGESVGLAQLISPEVLDQKITNLIGYSWTNRFDTSNALGNESGTHYLLSETNYLTLYGGIDSDTIISRPDAFNGVMASVQTRMAIEMGCFSAPREFFFLSANRKLLKNVEPSDEPLTVDAINRIKSTIAYLHQYLLGEQVTIDSSEVSKTYALFYNVYRDGKAGILASTESVNLPFMCDITRHPDNGISLTTESTPRLNGERVQKDPNYTIRAWSAVLTYLLSDFKFIYNSNTN